MPPGSTQYTLVGFSAELDWRPLRFVKPIPPHRVCDACGLVRNRTAVLPCRHTLCESCYELSARDGGRVCALDGHQFEEEDVNLNEFPAHELLRREVKCWNEESECKTVLPASQIARHFHRECRHHSIHCLRCSATVLCGDVRAHLESECSTAATPAGSECEGDSGRKDETALLASFRQIIEQQAGELKALMERLLVASGANGDRLNEISHGVNNCQESLREELRQGISSVKHTVRQEVSEARAEQRDCVKKCSDEITTFSEETKQSFLSSSDAIKSISNSTHALEKLLRDELATLAREKRDSVPSLPGGPEEGVEASSNATGLVNKVMPKPRDLQASCCQFVVKGVRSLEEAAWKNLRALHESEQVYLLGYCMSPGVLFIADCGVGLHGCVRLHKGDKDDVVQWPSGNIMKLHVVHPKGAAEREIADGPIHLLHGFAKPQEHRAQDVYLTPQYILLDDLIRDGYVEDDQLRVKFELLPMSNSIFLQHHR